MLSLAAALVSLVVPSDSAATKRLSVATSRMCSISLRMPPAWANWRTLKVLRRRSDAKSNGSIFPVGAAQQAIEQTALFDGVGQDGVELVVGGIADGGCEGPAERACAVGGGFQQRFVDRFADEGAGELIVENFEPGCNASFEREALEQAFAEGVDGLDLEAAGGFDGASEQCAGEVALFGRGFAFPTVLPKLW